MSIPPIRRIAIVGGTHGNENNGAFLVDSYRKNGGADLRRPSFDDVKLVTGNPLAVARTVRFVDDDLNRQFTVEALRELENPSYEAARAKALNALLGPKRGSLDAPGAPIPETDPEEFGVDFLIDLHTTTSNMGCCFMATPGLSLYVATYARSWLDKRGIPTRICLSGHVPRAQKGNLGSVGRCNLTIECGPTANGLVRHDIVAWMRESTERVLDCLDCVNRGLAPPMPPTGSWGASWARGITDKDGLPAAVVVNSFVVDPRTGMGKIAVPCDEQGKPTMMFAPSLQDCDFQPLRKGDPMFVSFAGEVIHYDGSCGDEVQPCFVNEAGYYFASSGLGFMLSVEKEVALDRPIVNGNARAVAGSAGLARL